MSKYRQRGYMDSDRESARPESPAAIQAAIEASRSRGPAFATHDGIWRGVEVHRVRSKDSGEHQLRQLLPKVQRCPPQLPAVHTFRSGGAPRM